MADDNTDDSQKTEDPTPRKLEESRKKGDVPLSRELNNWIMLLAGTIVILALPAQVGFLRVHFAVKRIISLYLLPYAGLHL